MITNHIVEWRLLIDRPLVGMPRKVDEVAHGFDLWKMKTRA